MTESHQDKLDAIIDEMLLEDPELSYETLAKWCTHYPEHREELSRFAATRAVQKALPEAPQVDEARITSRLMSHALGIMHRQDAARAAAPATSIRLCEAITTSGITEAEFLNRSNLDEILLAKLNRRLISAASIPAAAFERIANAIGRELAIVREMLTGGDPIPLRAHKSRSRPAAQTEDFLEAVKSSNLSDEAKSDWVRIVEAERKKGEI